MDFLTRQFVLRALDQAHERAWQAIAGDAPRKSVQVLRKAAEEIRDALLAEFENRLSPQEVQERIVSLVFGHPDGVTRDLLKRYAETLIFYLGESKNALGQEHGRREN